MPQVKLPTLVTPGVHGKDQVISLGGVFGKAHPLPKVAYLVGKRFPEP